MSFDLTALPDVEGEITCGGMSHAIRWSKGSLDLIDHDVDAERTVVSLGGDPCECLKVYEAWLAMTPHEGAMLLRPESEIPLKEIARQNLQYQALVQSRYMSSSHPSYAQAKEEMRMVERLVAIASLPPALLNALCAKLIAELDDVVNLDVGDTRSRKLLEEALSARANPALERCMRSWRRIDQAALVTVEAWLTEPEEEHSIIGWATERSGMAAVSLPSSWLLEVWAHGLSLVDDCFVLQVVSSEPDGSKGVLALRWERRYSQMQESDSTVPASADRWDTHFRDWCTPVVAPAVVTKSSSGNWRLSWAA